MKVTGECKGGGERGTGHEENEKSLQKRKEGKKGIVTKQNTALVWYNVVSYAEDETRK